MFLPREYHGQSSLVVYSPRGHKESDMTEAINMRTHTHKGQKSRSASYIVMGANFKIAPHFLSISTSFKSTEYGTRHPNLKPKLHGMGQVTLHLCILASSSIKGYNEVAM